MGKYDSAYQAWTSLQDRILETSKKIANEQVMDALETLFHWPETSRQKMSMDAFREKIMCIKHLDKIPALRGDIPEFLMMFKRDFVGTGDIDPELRKMFPNAQTETIETRIEPPPQEESETTMTVVEEEPIEQPKENKKMAKVLGIDLGTTYSCVAHIDDFKQAVELPNVQGNATTPSVVLFEGGKQDSPIVGEVAKNSFKLEPENGVVCVKRSIVKDECYEKPTKFPLGLTPTEISAYILKKLVADARVALELPEDDESVKDVVITVPADFGDVHRKRTAQAGQIAGLNVLALLNEPTAAAIAYGIRRTEPQNILVYDLGGGTFDATILAVKENEITTIATGGDRFCGGYDWDARIALKILEEYNRRFHTDFSLPVTEDEVLAAELKIQKMRASLLLEAEEIKKMLTNRRSMTTSWFFEEDRHGLSDPPFEITREVFEAETADLLDHTIDVVNEVLEAAKEKGISKIDKWLLVGGSSRMPQVAARLKEEFNCNPALTDPDRCVAKGAAIYASTLADGPKENEKEPICINDITSKTYGTDCKVDGKEMVQNLIFKGTELPTEKTSRFRTRFDNMKAVAMKIFESDSTEELIDPMFATAIDENNVLRLKSDLPAGTAIDVTFKVDKNGILSVYAVAEDGSEVSFTVNLQGVMDDKEIDSATKKMDDVKFK